MRFNWLHLGRVLCKVTKIELIKGGGTIAMRRGGPTTTVVVDSLRPTNCENWTGPFKVPLEDVVHIPRLMRFRGTMRLLLFKYKFSKYELNELNS